ncbi:unnamed protein product, partial [Cladocopium goreaui]
GAPFQQNPQTNGMPMNHQFPGMNGMTSNHSQGFPAPQPTMDATSQQGVQGYGTTGMAPNHSQGFPGANQPPMSQGQPGQPGQPGQAAQPPNYMMNSPPPNVAAGQPQNQPPMSQGQPPNYMMNSLPPNVAAGQPQNQPPMSQGQPGQPGQPGQAAQPPNHMMSGAMPSPHFMASGQQIPQPQAPHGHGRWGRATMNSGMPQSQSQGFPSHGLQGQQMNGSDYRGTSVGAPPAAQTSRPPSQAGPPQFGSVRSSMSRVCVNQGPTPEGFLPKGGTSQVSGISGRSAPRTRDTTGNQERPSVPRPSVPAGPTGVPTGSACNGTTPPAKPQARLPEEDDSDSDDLILVRTDTTKKWGLSMRNPGPRAAGVVVNEIREATPAHEWNCEVPLKPWRIKKEDVLLAVNSEVVDVANYKECLAQAGLYVTYRDQKSPKPQWTQRKAEEVLPTIVPSSSGTASGCCDLSIPPEPIDGGHRMASGCDLWEAVSTIRERRRSNDEARLSPLIESSSILEGHEVKSCDQQSVSAKQYSLDILCLSLMYKTNVAGDDSVWAERERAAMATKELALHVWDLEKTYQRWASCRSPKRAVRGRRKRWDFPVRPSSVMSRELTAFAAQFLLKCLGEEDFSDSDDPDISGPTSDMDVAKRMRFLLGDSEDEGDKDERDEGPSLDAIYTFDAKEMARLSMRNAVNFVFIDDDDEEEDGCTDGIEEVFSFDLEKVAEALRRGADQDELSHIIEEAMIQDLPQRIATGSGEARHEETSSTVTPRTGDLSALMTPPCEAPEEGPVSPQFGGGAVSSTDLAARLQKIGGGACSSRRRRSSIAQHPQLMEAVSTAQSRHRQSLAKARQSFERRGGDPSLPRFDSASPGFRFQAFQEDRVIRVVHKLQ